MVLSREKIIEELKNCSSVRCNDKHYVLPSFSYLINEFLPWFRRHLSRRKIKYAIDRFDCDDFAGEFCSSLKEAGLGLEENAGIAVAMLQVRNIENSLGVRAGEHMLNLVGVSSKKGHNWLIVEPQNQKYVLLEDYTTANNLRVTF
jgi:hypothetical protein